MPFVVAYLAGGIKPAITIIGEVRRRRVGVDLLMLLAALGAGYLGDWLEGAVLLFLFSLSNTLEAYAFYRTRRSIDSLISLRPREAMLVGSEGEVRVPIESLHIGDIVRAFPGERFAVDGEVTEGETWANEATLTGESAPVQKRVGDEIFAGTINGAGNVLVRMTRAVADTTLERVVRLVREAQSEKPAAQRFLESWEQPYVVGVLIAALLTFVGSWWLHDPDLHDAFYHAMVLLVVASPCAVVVGVPAAVLAAVTRAARDGILFKGGYHLDLLGRAEIVAFDKTGTITRGRPAVTAVWTSDGGSEDEVLRLAAAVERRSEHHLAEAIVNRARQRGLDLPDVTEFESHTGLGVHAHVEGRWVGVGREGLFETHDLPMSAAVQETARRYRADGKTALLVVTEGAEGVVALADEIRPEAATSLAALKALGVQQNVILTGDHENVARAVARDVGADEFRAGLLPDRKVLELRQLMDAGRVVAMVGDGVNDAPALAAASVGIAMGGAGTDVALEVADVVLMRDDLRGLPFAVGLGRKTRQRIRQNLTIAFGAIAVLIACSFLGLPLWLGVLGHEGSTVLVVLNGLRLAWQGRREGLQT
jgi:Cd2+/Zn2+-exporting ATPase